MRVHNVVKLFVHLQILAPRKDFVHVGLETALLVFIFVFYTGNGNDAVLYNTGWTDSPFSETDNAIHFSAPGNQ